MKCVIGKQNYQYVQNKFSFEVVCVGPYLEITEV